MGGHIVAKTSPARRGAVGIGLRLLVGAVGTFMRQKILIVDDNVEYLGLLRLSLKRAGFAIATAKTGMEALKKARSLSPNLILLDLVLPEMDGFAVCEVLRQCRATAAIPVIMLTGLTSEFTRYAGFESGATDYVTKPVSPKELITRIRHWLGQAPQSRPTASAPAEAG
jgi:DNA-binding response OmpR family regulator